MAMSVGVTNVAHRPKRPSFADYSDDDDTVDRKVAGQLIGVSPRSLEAYATTGDGPSFVRVGRRVVYRIGALRAWLRASEVTSTTTR